MSKNKAIPKGLKDQEVERGNLKRPPIPYIPMGDVVSDTVKKSKGKAPRFLTPYLIRDPTKRS